MPEQDDDDANIGSDSNHFNDIGNCYKTYLWLLPAIDCKMHKIPYEPFFLGIVYSAGQSHTNHDVTRVSWGALLRRKIFFALAR